MIELIFRLVILFGIIFGVAYGLTRAIKGKQQKKLLQEQEEADREAVPGREPFAVLAIGGVDERAVGQHAIDIEHDELDRFELGAHIRGQSTWHGEMLADRPAHQEPSSPRRARCHFHNCHQRARDGTATMTIVKVAPVSTEARSACRVTR